MSLPVRTTPEADAQIRSIADWWRANRKASPNLFADELSSSFDIIGHTPNIGRLYLKEQRAWISFKDDACRYFDNHPDFGREGTVIHYGECKANVIASRVRALNDLNE